MHTDITYENDTFNRLAFQKQCPTFSDTQTSGYRKTESEKTSTRKIKDIEIHRRTCAPLRAWLSYDLHGQIMRAVTRVSVREAQIGEESARTNRCFDGDVQDPSVSCPVLVLLSVSASHLETFGFHPELEFGVDVAAFDIDALRVVVLQKGLEDFVVFSPGDRLCLAGVAVSAEAPLLKIPKHFAFGHRGASAPFR